MHCRCQSLELLQLWIRIIVVVGIVVDFIVAVIVAVFAVFFSFLVVTVVHVYISS